MKYFILLLFFPAMAFSQVSKDLEKLFWMCDYASTQKFMDFSEATECSEVFEKIKKEKFNGNFSAFLDWWKQNKDIEYSKLNKKST